MITHPVRIGVQIQQEHARSYDHLRKVWIAADDLGVDTIFNWDHFFPLHGDENGTHFEAYTQLASMAEVTSNAKIGSLVTCNSYRNPNLLADMARTIDHISDGRFILGIGAGWFMRDYTAYGYEYGTGPQRVQALKRDLPKITKRLNQLNPKPVRGSIPLLVGGSGPKVTMKLAAQFAHTWHGFGSPEHMVRKNAILDAHCATIGRDPRTIERATALKSETLEQADAYIANNVTFLILEVGGPDFDLGPLRELIAWRDNIRRQQEQ